MKTEIQEKRQVLRVMKRHAKARMMGGNCSWADMAAKKAIKTLEGEIRELKEREKVNG